MKRDNGSAIILAILLLTFAMALSLNMFYMAQKKSERAGSKKKGIKIESNIDGGSSIAYFELNYAKALENQKISVNDTSTPSALNQYTDYFAAFAEEVTSSGTIITRIINDTTKTQSMSGYTLVNDAQKGIFDTKKNNFSGLDPVSSELNYQKTIVLSPRNSTLGIPEIKYDITYTEIINFIVSSSAVVVVSSNAKEMIINKIE